MDAAAIRTYEHALLDLDVQLRQIIDRAPVADRSTALRNARRQFLAAAAPLRALLLIVGHSHPHGARGIDAQAAVLALLEQVLKIAEDSGVPRSELVAVVNRETVQH